MLRIAITQGVRGYRALAAAAGLHPNTVKAWRRDPAFRAWWNRELLTAARDFMGPALHELVGIISSPSTPDAARIKACEAFFKGVEKGVPPSEASTAVLLEAFGPRTRAAVAMREGADGPEIAAVLSSGRGDELEQGQTVGAVEVTRHPEHAARLAVRVAEAASAEAVSQGADEAGLRTKGPAPMDARAPVIVRNLATGGGRGGDDPDGPAA